MQRSAPSSISSAALRLGVIIGLLGIAGIAGGAQNTDTATFCGGCFWCMQPAFDRHNVGGVISTTVGYTGGKQPNPTYEMVSSHQTSHCEAIQVAFDPSKINYSKLLDIYWKNVDPTTADRQFVDKGPQYRTAIFYRNDAQKRAALDSKEKLEKSGRFHGNRIATEILPATTFYPAENYHQQYYRKRPMQYKLYRLGSGRDTFFKRVWGNEADAH